MTAKAKAATAKAASNSAHGLPGFLISVEGVDGSGKSTQVRLLFEHLKGLGCRVHFSEWNSSDLVRGATKRGKKEQTLTPTTFSLLHATDFADRYERQILPRLEAGWMVLCDRYMHTAFARDQVRGCDPTWLRGLYSFAAKPDITFYYDLPQQVALDRILTGRPNIKYHEAGMDLHLHSDIRESFRIFQGRILQQYLGMVKPEGFVRMDATGGIHPQQEKMRAIVRERADLARYQRRSQVYKGAPT